MHCTFAMKSSRGRRHNRIHMEGSFNYNFCFSRPASNYAERLQ